MFVVVVVCVAFFVIVDFQSVKFVVDLKLQLLCVDFHTADFIIHITTFELRIMNDSTDIFQLQNAKSKIESPPWP